MRVRNASSRVGRRRPSSSKTTRSATSAAASSATGAPPCVAALTSRLRIAGGGRARDALDESDDRGQVDEVGADDVELLAAHLAQAPQPKDRSELDQLEHRPDHDRSQDRLVGSDSSTAAKGRKASTTTPVIAPLHRLFAPETRFSALREKEPQTG